MAQELMFNVYSIIDSELKQIENPSKKPGPIMKAIMKMKKSKAALSRFNQIKNEIQTIKIAEDKIENKKSNRRTLINQSEEQTARAKSWENTFEILNSIQEDPQM
jgi:hypothetical protein